MLMVSIFITKKLFKLTQYSNVRSHLVVSKTNQEKGPTFTTPYMVVLDFLFHNINQIMNFYTAHTQIKELILMEFTMTQQTNVLS